MDIEKYLRSKQKVIDKALSSCLSAGPDIPVVYQAMKYSLLSSGKRLRPILTLASAAACGGDERAVIPAACAIECIHAFTLIHDDLPAIDDSDLRRGRPSAHKKFGEWAAILAGDALCVKAFEILSGCYDSRVTGEIARAAGLFGVIGGEALDIQFEKKNVGFSQIKRMFELKTGALISASVRIGAIVSGADKKKLMSLTEYARHLGFAYQIVDDLLDVHGKTKFPTIFSRNSFELLSPLM